MFDLTNTVQDMAIDDTSSEAEAEADDDVTPRKSNTSDISPGTTFATFSFGASRADLTTPTQPPPISPSELPKAGFTFGTCPATPFLGTPTAEKGQFEYPDVGPTNVSPNPPYPPPPVGQTYRRASIVSRSSIDRRPSLDPRLSFASHPSPHATRRSSTQSTIATLPASDRRPSILHSSTYPALFPSSTSPSTSRRPSLMFPPKPLPVNIPPSLLARRGSLPVAQLFGIPTSDIPRARSSFAAQGSTGFGLTTTTPALYHRREPRISESGTSSAGSSQTVSAFNITDLTVRSSEITNPNSSGANSRRSSLPYSPNLPPPNTPLSTGRPSLPLGYRSSTPRNHSLSTHGHPSPPNHHDASPSARRTRESSTSNRESILSSHRSLSSSEESNEEDEEDSVDPLPTPSSFGSRGSVGGGGGGGGGMFTDPWADSGNGKGKIAGVVVAGKMGMGHAGGARDWERRASSGRDGRPVLESIPSDDTERGDRTE